MRSLILPLLLMQLLLPGAYSGGAKKPTWLRPPYQTWWCKETNIPYQSNMMEENKKMINQTTINLFLSQSSFLRSLTSPEHKGKYLEVSTENGLQMSKQCPMDKLVGCNDNEDQITTCIKKGPENFVACQEKNCPDCACALGFLLGYDCDIGSMVRIIRNTSLTMTDFRNILSTPHEEGQFTGIEEYLYVNYYGGLSFANTTNKLKESLSEHLAFWTNTNGKIRSKRQEPVTTTETIIAVGTELAKTIKETALAAIAELDKKIQKMKEETAQLSQKARNDIGEAVSSLFKAETRVTETRTILESLASETVDRVDKMVYYLNLVQDDWEQLKIAKFLKFQAKKMAELSDRSLGLLRDAHNQYTNITHELSNIKGKVDAVLSEIKVLRNKNTEEYKHHVDGIRKKVYLPCCLVGPIAIISCPICAAVLETTIKNWKKEMENMDESLKKSKGGVLDVETKLDDFISELEGECKLIANWQGKLIQVAELDFTFDAKEIFGFSAIKTEVVKTLNGLKTSAQNYLGRKSGSG